MAPQKRNLLKPVLSEAARKRALAPEIYSRLCLGLMRKNQPIISNGSFLLSPIDRERIERIVDSCESKRREIGPKGVGESKGPLDGRAVGFLLVRSVRARAWV